MSRATWIVSLVVAAAVLGAGAYWYFSRPALPMPLTAAAPERASLLLHLRVERLLASKAYDQLVVQRDGDRGIRRVAELCGFNPLAEVEEVLLFALPPEGMALPEWGALVRGDLDPRALADCVKRTLEARGRKSELRRASVHGVPCAVSSKGDSRACAVRNGLVLGTAASVEAALATLLTEVPGAEANPELMQRWKPLDPGADVRGVAVVPDRARRLLKLFGKPFLPERLTALTEVRAAAGQLYVDEAHLKGQLALDSGTPGHAAAIADALDALLQRARGIATAVPLPPAQELLRQTAVSAQGPRVQLTADYPVHTVGTMLDLAPAAARALDEPDAAVDPAGRDAGTRDAGKSKKDARGPPAR